MLFDNYCRQTTKDILTELEVTLNGLIDDQAPSEGLLNATQRAARAVAQFRQTSRQAHKTSREFHAYKQQHGLNLTSKSNIIAFST